MPGEDALGRYDACLAQLQADGRLPSVTAAVAVGGEPVWTGSIGADPATSYRIGSITKSMTAALVLQARDDGLLDLDDPLGKFVPESGYAAATLRSLLDHTSGMQSEPVGPWWERTAGVDRETLVAANDGSGRVAGAGEFFHYSNLGFGLLGEVVVRLRDADWWELVRGRLLEPLEMTATSYHPPADAAPGSSVDHFAGTITREPHADTGAMAPAGQLWSTVGDLLIWADLLATGHPDVLSADTVAEMRTPASPTGEYALGLRIRANGTRHLVGHTGTMPGFQASLRVDVPTRDAAVILANSTTGLPTDVAAEFLLDGTPVPPAEPWRPTEQVPPQMAELLGVWFWGNTGYGVEWRNQRVQFRSLRTGALDEQFVADGAGFVGLDGYHRGERLQVHRREDGSVSHLECATFVYTRTPYDPAVPIPGGHPG